MATELQSTIAENIRRVREAHRSAVMRLEGKWLKTDAIENGIAALRSLAPSIESWAERGTAAANTGKAPGANGWPGWLAAGRTLLGGIAEVEGIGSSSDLIAVREIAADPLAAPAATAKKAAKAVAEVAGEAAREVGSTVKTTMIATAVGVLGVAALYALYLYGGRR